jgi:hypothetical protein
MADEPGSARREALLVWVKLLGLLGLVFLFGLLVFALRSAI